MDEENQFQQITAARKYIAEQALKQQTKKVCVLSYQASSQASYVLYVVTALADFNGNNIAAQ